MVADPIGKRVLVLSDNDGLSRAIALSLKDDLRVEVIRLAPSLSGKRGGQSERGRFDLITLALSSPSNEPIVALARASLVGEIGQIPLLIISDRPFRSTPADKITHLDFPFNTDELCHKVREILEEQPDTNSAGSS